MAAIWWDEIHWIMWRIAGRSALLPIIQSARKAARETIVPLLALGARSGCEWTAEKARILASLDANGLTSILSFTEHSFENHGIAMPLALAAWELAWVDGGAATCSLSGSLAQMPIRDFGTKEQRERYLGGIERRHGALCLTEPIPGAGADATSLTGSVRVVDWLPGKEPILEVHKRGRFISHMDFADFVVAAVQGCGDRVRGSCLAILEPGDAGEFDRGLPVRKLGHQLSSATNPVFRLRVPAARIVGGYTMNDGVVVPNVDHREGLAPGFRRVRAVLSLMTASKLLSTVEALVRLRGASSDDSDDGQRLVDVWATGEAATALGFSAVRLSDALDMAVDRRSAPASKAAVSAVLCPAAKLFSTSHATTMLQRAAALGKCGPMESDSVRGPGGWEDKLIVEQIEAQIDAQIEAIYLGPEAIQRRQVSAAMIGGEFLSEFRAWTEDMENMDGVAQRLPPMGVRCLAAAMRLWRWTLDQLRRQTDARGARLYCDARQGVTFPMADALSWLLAARALTLDVLELELAKNGGQGTATLSVASFFTDLSAIASLHAAGSVRQTCVELLFGYDGQFPVSAVTASAFDDLRTKLDLNLSGAMAARDRATRFLRAL
jgi:alkylation response protein AidB-like acyl-CoA dehydrogenase